LDPYLRRHILYLLIYNLPFDFEVPSYVGEFSADQ
jgi:hypothetical protein